MMDEVSSTPSRSAYSLRETESSDADGQAARMCVYRVKSFEGVREPLVLNDDFVGDVPPRDVARRALVRDGVDGAVGVDQDGEKVKDDSSSESVGRLCAARRRATRIVMRARRA